MTLIGVRNSCDASAVNSAWRRWTISSGAEARRPTTSEPMKVTNSKTKPNRISGASEGVLHALQLGQALAADQPPVTRT